MLEKAEQIANEWGLKNARAAVEAVFRKYCDDYLYGRMTPAQGNAPLAMMAPAAIYGQPAGLAHQPAARASGHENGEPPPCEALDALDRLLAL